MYGGGAVMSTSTAEQQGLSTTAAVQGSDAAFIAACDAFFVLHDAEADDDARAVLLKAFIRANSGRLPVRPS